MVAKLSSIALAVALAACAASAQPDPMKPDDKKLVTRLYNIKHLIGDHGKASGLADADAVVKLFFEAIPRLRELKPGANGSQIVERDGGKLEIRATAATHAEVKDLLDALERLQDVAVDVKADVIELAAADYERLVKALPKVGKGKPPVLHATGEEVEENIDKKDAALEKAMVEMSKILKAGRLVQTSSARFANGAEATISSRRTVVTYTNAEAAVLLGSKVENPQFVKEGFGLVALPVVSADRRFVRFKLTEQATVVTGMKKRELGEIGGKPIVVQSPVTEDLGATGSAVVADGGTMLFRLAYAPKDKVWVVVVKPTIFIQAEEDEIKRQQKKEEKK